MKQLISRIMLILILIISILVSVFPALANSTTYHILYFILIGITVLYMILKIKSGNFKYNLFFIIILFLTILGIYYRDEKQTIYALGFACMLFSYYVFEICEIDEKFLNTISLIISFATIPTLIFNGIFNTEIVGGTAFSGRLNPFMYFPYILIAIQYNKRNKALTMLLKILVCLVLLDIIWSGSRVALLSMLFVLIMYFLMNNKKTGVEKILNSKSKKRLKILLLIVIIFHVTVPQIYLWLYQNYRDELNEITLELTGKSFFSGRQRIWSEIDANLEEKRIWGTGDADYKDLVQPPHNEFMNLYYCWGILVALTTYIYLYTIGIKCIKNAINRIDQIVILGFISMLICTTFETYQYAVHFFIFNTILVSYLLNKNKLKKGKENDG